MSEYPKPIKTERIDNPDGSYITKELNEDNTSCIRYWDKNTNNIKCEFYSDNNFQKLEMTSENKFRKDGSYIAKQVYVKPTSSGYHSIIGWYDSQKQNIKTKEFSYSNFKKLIRKSYRHYNQDGTIKEFVYNYIDNEYYINIYSSENKILTSLQYTDKNFSKLFCTYKYSYNENGDYKIEEFYEQPMEDGFLCYVGYYNAKNQLTSYQWYADSSCTELGIDVQVYYNEDLSSKQLKKYYKGTDYIGIYNKKVYSKEILFDKDKQDIYTKSYGDLNFTELLSETSIEHLKNDWLRFTILYPTPQNDSDGQISEVHIMQNQYYWQSISKYEDKECKKLISKTSFDYKNNGQYDTKTVYFSENKNNIIEKYNFKNELRQIIEYEDDKFKKTIKKQTFFYYYDGINSKDVFIEHLQEQYSEFKKLDIDGNIINTKKCNCTGILAYFIFYPIALPSILFYLLLTAILTVFCGYIALLGMSLAYMVLGIWLKSNGDEY